MKLIIEIDDDVYKNPFNYCCYALANDIKNGTPFPKGHGRLIDADDLKRIGRYAHTNTDIDNAPTIIEADKEGL